MSKDKRAFIKLEMSRHHWAITQEALRGIVSFIEDDSELSFELFHNEENKPSAYFGEMVEGSYHSYRSGNIGVISIDGPIIPRATWLSQISGIASIDILTDEYKAFLEDSTIEEIVLVMDTPGGVTTGISDFASLIKSSEKKTTAFAWMAASAGYWIASACDQIVCPVGGMTGSIGVVTGYVDDTERDKKNGVKRMEFVSSQSPNKRANPETESGRVVVQQLLDDLADGFISTVAENRNTTVENVIKSFGGGAVFAEQRALEVGMIDSVMDFESFINSKIKEEKQPAKGFGFSMEGKENMSDDKDKTLSSEEIAKAERERIQSVESLTSLAEGKHPDVVKAAKEKVDSIKFDAGISLDKAESLVLKAISGAQDTLIKGLSADKEEGKKTAVATSKPVPPKATGSSEAGTNELLAAVSNLNANGGHKMASSGKIAGGN